MLSKAVNGFTAADVDKVIRGYYGTPEFRYRAELLTRRLEKLRDLDGSLDVRSSRIFHNATAEEIRRSAKMVFQETTLDLPSWRDTVISQAPLFFLRLGESSGTVATDDSGNGRTGTYNGTVGYSQPSLAIGAPENTAILFNGTNTYVSIADASWMDVTTQMTLAVHLKTTASGTFRNIISRDDTASNKAWQFRITDTGLLQFVGWFTSGSNPGIYTTSAIVNDGAPHNCIAILDGSFVRLIIDDIEVLRTAETRSLNNVTLAIEIGRINAAGQYFDGTLDETAMWNRGLTPAEVRNSWQAASGDLRQVLFERDFVRAYGALKMPTNGTDGTAYAEWPLVTGELASPNRKATATSIRRDCIVQGLESLLQSDSFGSRHTIGGAVNYITGTNGILSIIQNAARGIDTTGWAITNTTKLTPATIDFEIGTTRLAAVNTLLGQINYKPVRFLGDGKGVLEPNTLPENRAEEDTLVANSQSILVDDMEEDIETTSPFNEIVIGRPNPDVTTINASAVNDAITNDGSTTATGRRHIAAGGIDAVDQATLDAVALQLLSLQPTRRIRVRTLHRPFHDDEDIIHLTDIEARTALGFDAKCIEEEWTLPLDPREPMEHVLRKIETIS